MKKALNNQRGFTLIELMITIAIAAILLTIGVPSFTETIKNNRLATTANAFVTAASLARSEAVKRGSRVTVCKSNDGATCTNANNWDQGWIVFTDENNNAAYNNATETLLRVADGLGNGQTLTGNANVANYLSYVASGQSQLTTGAFQAGTVSLCDDRTGNFGRDLVMSASGRISLSTGVACP